LRLPKRVVILGVDLQKTCQLLAQAGQLLFEVVSAPALGLERVTAAIAP
jgi:hypothetical protein